jgi:secreted PhoX family phosphatase
MLTRRNFGLGLVSGAFGGLALSGCGGLSPADLISRIPKYSDGPMRRVSGYGELVPDPRPRRLLDLPKGFRYKIISRFRDELPDGRQVPDNADGMGSFVIDEREMVLVRNHELPGGAAASGPLGHRPPPHPLTGAYDSGPAGALPGGTTTIVFDYREGVVTRQYLSLAGTIDNCAGGVAPWGSWLSCEENFSGTSTRHGFVFDVPALAGGLVEAKPLTHLGRFNHEAVAVDDETGIAYLTEDQVDSLFYRYVPPPGGDARQAGGQLQALVFADSRHGTDGRNWDGRWRLDEEREVVWKTLDPAPPDRDDLRKRGRAQVQAVRFANGEGLYFDRQSRELFFTCTSGGRIKSGQVLQYFPSPHEGEARETEKPARLKLFLEATDTRRFNYGDNLVVAPNGHLLVCEDPYFGGEENYLLRPISEKLHAAPPCEVYDIARLHGGSELAGACFSPDGGILFLNVYSPAATLAICGPWDPVPRPEWALYRADGGGVLGVRPWDGTCPPGLLRE